MKHYTHYTFMPSIEGQALFSYEALEDIRQIVLPFKARIPIVRFGLEDMLGFLGMQLEKNRTLFDVAVLGRTVSMLIAVFKPHGFEISGGVYRYYEDDAGFVRNIREDMRQGLWGKTLIHPRQIDLANEAYKVDENSLKKAQIFFAHHDHAITAQNGQMLEHATMQRVMQTLLERAKHYGVTKV
jgi:citrate lyase beta subunit